MTVPLPQFTDGVDYRYFIEPLNAPGAPVSALDRFPNSVYTKSPDSHFVRFMYTLLGPVGVGWLQLGMTELRLALEATGADLADLDAFYGDPFSFGRILSEAYDVDTSGLLPAALWDQLRAQDESYRSRALEFLRAAGQGTTPLGMALAASSGLGQNVEIIENYQYLFDSHDDDLLGLAYYGSTLSTGEFIILPVPEISFTEQQTIDFTGAGTALGSNAWIVTLNGFGTPTPPATGFLTAATRAPDLQAALEQVPTIGPGNVSVSGGPAPADFVVTFINDLSNQALPTLGVEIVEPFVGTPIAAVPVLVMTGGVDPNSENATISDAAKHSMQVAIDYLRPVGAYPSFSDARSHLHSQPWTSVSASSQYTQVIRFVTGTTSITWPTTANHWIVASSEEEAPQLHNDVQQHYVGFHNIASIQAYTDAALTDLTYLTSNPVPSQYASVHAGPFPEMASVMPYFAQFTDLGLIFAPGRGLADYPEPLTVSSQTADGTAYINNIYPADYASLPGVPTLAYHDDHFWSSRGRQSGTDYLEIDLGSPQAVNYISIEVSRKPVSIGVDYDLIDQSPSRVFAPVVPIAGFPLDDELFFDPGQQSPWEYLELYFNDGLGMIFTRFIRLSFTRRADSTTYGRFLYDTATQVQTPWSIEVRNLRIGRNVAPSVL